MASAVDGYETPGRIAEQLFGVSPYSVEDYSRLNFTGAVSHLGSGMPSVPKGTTVLGPSRALMVEVRDSIANPYAVVNTAARQAELRSLIETCVQNQKNATAALPKIAPKNIFAGLADIFSGKTDANKAGVRRHMAADAESAIALQGQLDQDGTYDPQRSVKALREVGTQLADNPALQKELGVRPDARGPRQLVWDQAAYLYAERADDRSGSGSWGGQAQAEREAAFARTALTEVSPELRRCVVAMRPGNELLLADLAGRLESHLTSDAVITEDTKGAQSQQWFDKDGGELGERPENPIAKDVIERDIREAADMARIVGRESVEPTLTRDDFGRDSL